jgi:MYXO-CTERM domain-containing protein
VGQVIPGNSYTVILQASIEDTASIAQTALIPDTAESIFFTASSPYSSGWQVTVAGQIIPVFQVSNVASGIYVYEGNILAFAGQTDELQFTALAGGGSPVNMELDNIQFSSSPVPEPSALGLAVLGGLFFARRRWQNFLL